MTEMPSIIDEETLSRPGQRRGRRGPALRRRRALPLRRLAGLRLSLVLVGGVVVVGTAQLSGEEWGDLKFSLAQATMLREGSVRLALYYSVAYDQLRFLSREDEYLARVYVTAVCLDHKGNQKAGEIWERKISVSGYEETRLRTRFLLDSLSLAVDPGRYTLRVEIKDRYSQRRGSRELEVEVRDLRGTHLSVSDLKFLASGDEKSLLNPSRSYDGSSPLIVSFEVYRFYSPRSFLAQSWRVKDVYGKTALEGASSIAAPQEINGEVLRIALDTLPPGQYEIAVSLEDEDRKERAETKGAFSFNPPAFLSEEGYLKLVEQLEYVASSSELRTLKEADPDERESLWDAFWKEKDPSPGTERNEAKEEYFKRVEYANRHFSGFREGWKTDMGRIHIIYGTPDDIERHPFDLDSPPYEVWYYYGEGLKFVFVDEHGLGEYKLVYPREAAYRQPKFK